MANHIPVIIPTIKKDYLRMRDLVVKRIFMYLPVRELTFIGDTELCDIVSDDISGIFSCYPVKVLNEENLLARQPVVERITERVNRIDEELALKVRSGWYYQQFLKMAYHEICDGEYYMTWDMDTVPLREIEMFDGSLPCFDTKREYNPGYFKTIENLLGLDKNVEGSFVSEHMIFKTDFMKELIEAMEGSKVAGEKYWEKIIEALDEDHITLGFSEFETYGTFVSERHPDDYRYRKFNSFRRGSWFVREKEVTDEDIAWLANDYDAVTFENAEPIDDMVKLFRNPKYRNNMSARKFYETILESGYFGDYSDGRIDAGDWYAPV